MDAGAAAQVIDAFTVYCLKLADENGFKNISHLICVPEDVPPFKSELNVMKESLTLVSSQNLFLALSLMAICPNDINSDEIQNLLKDYLPEVIPYSRCNDRFWSLIETFDDIDNVLKFFLKLPSSLLFPWSLSLITWNRSNATEWDPRNKPVLNRLFLQGLTHTEENVRKNALFLVRQCVKADLKQKDPDGLRSAWQSFFACFLALQETQAHLVKPLLPTLHEDVLGVLGLDWWRVCLLRVFDNPSVSVNRLVLKTLAAINALDHPSLLTNEGYKLLAGELLGALSNSFLYVCPEESSSVISAFGQQIAKFYGNLLEQDHFASSYIIGLAENVVAAVPLIYLIQPLTITRIQRGCFKGQELNAIQAIAASRGLHNPKARNLVHWMLLQSMIVWTDCNQVSFQKVAKTLNSLSINSCSKGVSAWLVESFSEDLIVSSMKEVFEQALSPSEISKDCLTGSSVDFLGTTCAYFAGKPQIFVRCMQPLFKELSLLSETVPFDHLTQNLRVLLGINTAISSSYTNHSILPELCGRMLDYCQYIERALLIEVEGQETVFRQPEISIDDLLVLLEAFVICLGKAKESGCIPFLDILVKKLLDNLLLPILTNNSSVQDRSRQLSKIVLMVFLDAACLLYNRLKAPLTGIQERLMTVVDLLLEVCLQRPANMTHSGEWQDWPRLEQCFACAKFNLLSQIIEEQMRHGMPSRSDADAIILHCLEAAADECKYKALLSAFACIKRVMAVAFSGQHVPLIVKTAQDILAHSVKAEPSRWVKAYGMAAIDVICSPEIMSVRDSAWHNPQDGCVQAGFCQHFLLENLAKSKYSQIAVYLAQTLAALYREKLSEGDREWFLDAYTGLFVQLSVYGPIRDLPEASLADSVASQLALGRLVEDVLDDSMARVYILSVFNNSFLTVIQGESLAGKLLDFLDVPSGSVTERLKRIAFPNTLINRHRLRAWQALLVLSETWRDSFVLQPGIPKILSALMAEPLPDTRLYAEWLLIKLCLRVAKGLDLIYDCLQGSVEFAAGFLISLIDVVGYVLVDQIKSSQKDVDFKRGLDALTPWFLHNSPDARVRVFWAFDAVVSAYKQNLKMDGNVLLPLYEQIYAMLHSKHAQLFVNKLLTARPLLNTFDPVGMWSLEGIFFRIPQMTGSIAADERIPPECFEPVDKNLNFLNVPIRTAVKYSDAIILSRKDDAHFDDEQSCLTSAFFQQKFDGKEKFRASQVNPVIVVASLLDRIPNMAGMCRTAEIFGCECLVLPEDPAIICNTKDFQNVAMTADKHMPMIQRTPDDLPDYISGKRKEGYTIVALEQSSHSIELQSYAFPEKFVLILGNEREGVRPDILHLCDVCLEIPQFGNIRSLNVHVAGSMVLWEARRQQFPKTPK